MFEKEKVGLEITPLSKKNIYTIADIYALPDGERAELIDGKIYNMMHPNRIHQRIATKLTGIIDRYISDNRGLCEVYPAPFAVFLNGNDKTYVEPDISVICDPRKLNDKGCNGAPDWIIEIVSSGSQRMDYMTKLFAYADAGVREYWIVDPMTEKVIVYSFGEQEDFMRYSFDEEIPAGIGLEFKINMRNLM